VGAAELGLADAPPADELDAFVRMNPGSLELDAPVVPLVPVVPAVALALLG
jgi:hypothetical protein